MQDEKKAADAIAREARRTAAAGVIFAVLWMTAEDVSLDAHGEGDVR